MLILFTLTLSSVGHVDDCMSLELWLEFVQYQSARTEGEHAYLVLCTDILHQTLVHRKI